MLKPHDRIGPYTILRRLGKGGFGEVWLAEKRTPLAVTEFALKLPLEECCDLGQIRREAEIWKRAGGHPNVLPIIEADIYDDRVVIVSEYAMDGSLADWLRKYGGRAPSVEAAVEMTLGILAGLAHLHARGILHRDLKPSNILLQGDVPRIVDFGLARVLRASQQSATVSGTLHFMAPEAFQGTRSEATEIWSAGVLLHLLLCGRLPFPQEDPATLMHAILFGVPETLPDGVPGPVRAVVRQALERDPSRRFRGARAMRKALEAARDASLRPGHRHLPTGGHTPAAETDAATETLSSVAFPPSPPTPPTRTDILPAARAGGPRTVSPPSNAFTTFLPAPAPPVGGTALPFVPGAGTGTAPARKRRFLAWILTLTGIGMVAGLVFLVVYLANLEKKGTPAPGAPSAGASSTGSPGGGGTGAGPVKPGVFQDIAGTVGPDGKEIILEFTNSLKMTFVRIPPGTFRMGAVESDAATPHRVTFAEPFYIQTSEVTQAQWKAVMGSNPSFFQDDRLPVESVSWDDAQAFIRMLNRRNEGLYRLPTEAEWEYACRAGTTAYFYGQLREIGWFEDNAGNTAHPVKTKKPNPWGLYDMSGNVWEWCEDVWHPELTGLAPTHGNAWTRDGDPSRRVIKGGGWDSLDAYCRTVHRAAFGKDWRNRSVGLRLAVTVRF
ncbi:MAG: SUMF1/EgtB/PvdO family nonheme iron enzyme [Acidobacteria bacterium]|nr:SUMF1/EgtB/PvdO family nonheme iron enzyme [Acidobacteriota bacterium]